MRLLFRPIPPVVFLMAALLSSAFCPSGAAADAGAPERIISMAPSTTEILFALGLGDRVAGVTRYCDYPEAAKAVPKVGGYVDPSYEAIVGLNPDLVILLASHQDAERELAKMKIPTLMIPHDTLPDIHRAIRKIGETCGARERAAAMLDSLGQRTDAVREAVKGRPKPRVLVCIGRDTGSEQLVGMYFAGKNSFHDEIVGLAGGVNAYQDTAVAYPQLSAEGVIQLNPDAVIELANHINPNGKTAAQIADQWGALRPVAAVRAGRVHVIAGSHALRPGPRYAQFLEELARLLHPDCFTKEDAGG